MENRQGTLKVLNGRPTEKRYNEALRSTSSAGRGSLSRESEPIRLDVYRVLRQKSGYPVKEAIPLAEEISQTGLPPEIPLENGKVIHIHHRGVVWHDPEETNE